MVAKIVFLCASALFVQSALAQVIRPGSYVAGNSIVENDIFIGNTLGRGSLNLGSSGLSLGGSGLSLGLANSGLSGVGVLGGGIGSSVGLIGGGLSSGVAIGSISDLNIVSSGPLVVTSISPIGPSGLAVASENVIEGNLLVSGSLPFLSAVAFEGALPSAGSGLATCGCGSGSVGIISDGYPQPLPAPVYGIGSGIGGIYF